MSLSCGACTHLLRDRRLAAHSRLRDGTITDEREASGAGMRSQGGLGDDSLRVLLGWRWTRPVASCDGDDPGDSQRTVP